MAKLAMLGPRIPTMDTRAVKTFSAARPVKISDAFYSSAKWMAVRDAARRDAGGQCQWPGCSHHGRWVDHKVERRDGGADYDRANLWLLCSSHHQIKTADERTKRKQRHNGPIASSTHPEWLAPSRIPLVIVCGPPASGKTTWARAQCGEGYVIDLDDIMARLSGRPEHSYGREWLDPAIRERNRMLGRLSNDKPPWPSATLIVAESKAERRGWWAKTLRPTRIVVCETPEHICWQRIAADPDRARSRDAVSAAVARWWNEYTPRVGDEAIHPY